MDFPAYLATMPMHAITEIHGEPGLLERFRLEIRAFDARRPGAARPRRSTSPPSCTVTTGGCASPT